MYLLYMDNICVKYKLNWDKCFSELSSEETLSPQYIRIK